MSRSDSTTFDLRSGPGATTACARNPARHLPLRKASETPFRLGPLPFAARTVLGLLARITHGEVIRWHAMSARS